MSEQPDEQKIDRDPLEKYDMRAELEELRKMLQGKGYRIHASSGAGEIWIEEARKFRATLLSDVNGRIRLEIRNPDGSIRTEISPAWPVDVEKALP